MFFKFFKSNFLSNASYLFFNKNFRYISIYQNHYFKPEKLQTKFFNFFQSNENYTNNTLHISNKNIQIKKVHLNDLKNLNHQELLQLFINLYLEFPKVNNISSIITLLDQECCARFHHLSFEEILQILDGFFLLKPNLTKLNFYKKDFISLMDSKCQNLSKNNLIKGLFYLGFSKMSLKANSIFNKCYYVNLKYLKPEEMCIFLEVSFKVNFPLNEEILNELVEIFEKNPIVYFQEPAFLVTCVKVFRRNYKYINYGFMKNLSNYTLKYKKLVNLYTFTAHSHLICLFAQSYFYEENSFNLLIKTSINSLKINNDSENIHSSLTIRPRAKDICRMLWSLAHFGIRQNEISNFLEALITATKQRRRINEFKPNEFLTCLLSLVMICDPKNEEVKQLLETTLNHEFVKEILALNKIRYDARLALLLTCIQIETPQVLNFQPPRIAKRIKSQTNVELDKRKGLKIIWRAVKKLEKKYSFTCVKCIEAVPNLYISGIWAPSSDGWDLAIELFDNFVCLYGRERPHGLFSLKLRLLEAKENLHLVLVKTSDLQKLNTFSDIVYLIEKKIEEKLK